MARRKKRARVSLLERLSKIEVANARPAAVAAGWVTVGFALVAAWVLGVPRLEARAALQGVDGPIEIRFVEAPAWTRDAIVDELRGRVRAELSPDPLKRDDLIRVRAALMASGWFDAVEQVRRVHAGLVEVSGRFARPAAVLRERESTLDHLIDERGRLLPRTFPAGQSGITAIVGSWSSLPAIPDAPWVAQEVQAALELLELVRPKPWRTQVHEIHVRREGIGSTMSLTMISDRKCVIVWGRPPGREGAGEVPADRKLQYLDYHHEHYGHIDRGMNEELDITGDVVIGR